MYSRVWGEGEEQGLSPIYGPEPERFRTGDPQKPKKEFQPSGMYVVNSSDQKKKQNSSDQN